MASPPKIFFAKRTLKLKILFLPNQSKINQTPSGYWSSSYYLPSTKNSASNVARIRRNLRSTAKLIKRSSKHKWIFSRKSEKNWTKSPTRKLFVCARGRCCKNFRKNRARMWPVGPATWRTEIGDFRPSAVAWGGPTSGEASPRRGGSNGGWRRRCRSTVWRESPVKVLKALVWPENEEREKVDYLIN